VDEPIYTFKRGVGWVPNEYGDADACITHDHAGYQYLVYIYKRPPKVGERGFWLDMEEWMDLTTAKVDFYYDAGWGAGWVSRSDYGNNVECLVTLVTVPI
jgi:hypothetical protein